MINTKRFGTELNPLGFPNGEFNKDLEVSASPTPKEFPSEIPSLNPDIMRNFSQEAKNLKFPETTRW